MNKLKNTFKFVEEASLDELTRELQKYGIEFEEESGYSYNKSNYVTSYEEKQKRIDSSK